METCGKCGVAVEDYLTRKAKVLLTGDREFINGVCCPNPDCSATYTLSRVIGEVAPMPPTFLSYVKETTFGMRPAAVGGM